MHVRHVILARVGYNWHVAVHGSGLLYIASTQLQEQLVPGKPLLLPNDVIFIAC